MKNLWLEKNGFSEDGFTYSIVGEDTYSIKDWLKEQGCKYHPFLGWHYDRPLELPEGFDTVCFSFDEICIWDEKAQTAWYKEKSKEVVERKLKEAAGPSLSEYIGSVGERLYHLTAIYKSTRGFIGSYGWTHIHTFQMGEDILVWFTQKGLNFERGQTIDLTATVKKHEEFRGVKTTQLSRCIVIPVLD